MALGVTLGMMFHLFIGSGQKPFNQSNYRMHIINAYYPAVLASVKTQPFYIIVYPTLHTVLEALFSLNWESMDLSRIGSVGGGPLC